MLYKLTRNHKTIILPCDHHSGLFRSNLNHYLYQMDGQQETTNSEFPLKL